LYSGLKLLPQLYYRQTFELAVAEKQVDVEVVAVELDKRSQSVGLI
jgi:hypothetical protein